MARTARTTKAPPAKDPAREAQLRTVHERMVLVRRTEETLLALVRSGPPWSGPVYPATGQEAVTAVASVLMQPQDHACITPRETGMLLCRGVTIRDLVWSHAGALDGLSHGHSGAGRLGSAEHGVVPTLGSTASTLAVGLGMAMTMAWKQAHGVVVGFHGDGVMNTGTWHEVINMLAVQRAPMVLVCNNNGMSLGTPVAEHSPTATLAERAEAYGMPFATVDGTDVEAMLDVLGAAMERARTAGGGTLVEVVTPRLGGHASDAPGPVPAGAVDVIPLLQRKLLERGVLDDAAVSALEQRVAAELEEAVRSAPQQAVPGAPGLLAGVYA